MQHLTWKVSWLAAALSELLQLGLLVHLLLLQVLVPVRHLSSQVRHLIARIHLNRHLDEMWTFINPLGTMPPFLIMWEQVSEISISIKKTQA